MINSVNVTGRISTDIEFRVTPSGVQVSSFSIAVNRSFTNSNGEREADFFRVVTFRKTAEMVNNHLHKGSLIGISGKLQSRSYDGNDGQRKFVVEIVAENIAFLEPKNSQNNANSNAQQTNYNQTTNTSYNPQNVAQGQNNANNGYTQPPQNNPFANAEQPIESMDINTDDLPF